ncbi:hypothetical protein H696_00268 [Fonticula alba]|uniref:Cwf19-like C-terminal domain-containing protein n=1 Tax=Fonticula alba TaxID=691883 RepID=A0A058ZE93_FONAL|nr:hypothetical protein H696_00268 [Fonticula alba]KCV72689.1 hypothetical protein H696_00268 [Fonticula alba]|eukprot:XP_009492390.1 hypothetical protein H696_00268 [Fonticula alba]
MSNAPAQSPARVLVSGAVKGRFKTLFDRVAQLQQKHRFDLLFLTGDPFGEDEEQAELQPYLMGEVEIPVDTYFITHGKMPQSVLSRLGPHGELCPNLTFLGPAGVVTLPSGVKVAYVSGAFFARQAHHSLPAFALDEEMKAAAAAAKNVPFTQREVDVFRNIAANPAFTGVDVLLTSCWPGDLAQHLKDAPPATLPPGDLMVGRLARCIRPRYHFASTSFGEPVFYERLPYRNDRSGAPGPGQGPKSGGRQEHRFGRGRSAPSDAGQLSQGPMRQILPQTACRFYGLADVGNTAKSKWLFAFNLPAVPDPQLPKGTTNCPYPMFGPAPVGFPSQPPGALVNDRRRGGGPHDGPFHDGRPQKFARTGGMAPASALSRPADTGCWFCLSNPGAEKHLVISLGELAYVALAKGALQADHILLTPMSHSGCLNLQAADGAEGADSESGISLSTAIEIEKYKDAIRRAFAKARKRAFFFEVIIPRPSHSGPEPSRFVHAHIQAVPVPASKCDDVMSILSSEIERISGAQLERAHFSEEASLADPLAGESAPEEGWFRQRAIELSTRTTELLAPLASPEVEAPAGSPASGVGYFRCEIPHAADGADPGVFVCPIAGFRFPMQLGRLVAVGALGLDPSRVDWKNCIVPNNIEARQAADFREFFSAFEPTFEEEEAPEEEDAENEQTDDGPAPNEAPAAPAVGEPTAAAAAAASS